MDDLNKQIEELEAELTYWKETTNYWKETTNYWKEKTWYWTDVAFEFERHNKELKETAENWKELYKETDSGLQYLKSYSSNLEKALNNSIKSVDK